MPNLRSLRYVSGRLSALIEAMRPRHWVKNSVVAAAPLFALTTGAIPWLRAIAAFWAFSATASAFYLINDVLDLEEDRRHPVKRHRPIAAGRLSVSEALTVALGLLLVGTFGSLLISPWLATTIGAYVFLQVAYNFGLKQQPILDIMALAGGFVLRALGGAAAAGVSASGWFILCIGLLALFLGIEKRKAELKAIGGEKKTRAVMGEYSLSWLRRMESVATASALMAYALWALEGAETPWMLVTLPFVAYAIFRYQYLSEQGKGETPERLLTRDLGMVVSVLLWGVITLFTLAVST